MEFEQLADSSNQTSPAFIANTIKSFFDGEVMGHIQEGSAGQGAQARSSILTRLGATRTL